MAEQQYNYNQQYLGVDQSIPLPYSVPPNQQVFGNARMNPGAGDFNISSLVGITDPAMQMLINQHIMPLLLKQMGPNAVAANYGQGNVYTEGLLKNAMGDRNRVTTFGKQQDTGPMQNAITGIAKMMGVNMGAREKEAMASMLPMLSEMMPGLDALIPGGLDSFYGAKGSAYKMAEGMYSGSRYRTDAVTGDRKMSGESILDITKRVHKNLYGDNADISEMSGLTAGQAGSLFDEMQKRGMTGGGARSRGDSLQKVADEMGKTIGDISELPELDQKLREIDANGISQKLKSMSKAVSAMKEIFGEAGQPNAPMAQVMGAIESLTQTNLQSMKPAEVENLIRSTHNASKIAGITMPQAYAQMGNVAGMLDRAGGDRIFAADTYIKSANETAAGKRIFGESTAFGRLTPDKMLNLNEQINVQATVDPVANEYAKIINSVERYGAKLPEGSDLAAVYKALKDPNNNGEYTDASGKKKTISSILNSDKGINGMLRDAGMSDTSIGFLSDETLNKQTIFENKGVQPAVRKAISERQQTYLRSRFQGIGDQFSNDKGFNTSDKIKNFMKDEQNMAGIAETVARDQLNVDAKGLENPQAVALASIVSSIEKSQNRKLSEDEKKSLIPVAASMVNSATSHFKTMGFTSYASAQEALSPEVQREAAIVKKEMDQTTKFQSALSSLGKSNITQRISDFIQNSSQYTTVGQGLESLLGYVPGNVVAKLLKPEIEDIKSKREEYVAFNANTAKSEYLTSAIAVNKAALDAKPGDAKLLEEKEALKKELKDNGLLGGKNEEDTYNDRVATSDKAGRYQLSNAQESTLKLLDSKGDTRSTEEEAKYKKLVELKKTYNDSTKTSAEKSAAYLDNMKSTYGLTSEQFKGRTAQDLSPDIKDTMLESITKGAANIDTTLTSLNKLSGGFTERSDLGLIEKNLGSYDKGNIPEGLIGLNKFVNSYSRDSQMLAAGGKEGKNIINKINEKVKEIKSIQKQFGVTEEQALTGDFLEAKVVSKEKLDALKLDATNFPSNSNKQDDYNKAKQNYDKFNTPNEEYRKVIALKEIELKVAQDYSNLNSKEDKSKFKEIALKNIDTRISEINSSSMSAPEKKMALDSVQNQKDILTSKRDIKETIADLSAQRTALTKPEEILKQNILYNKKSEVSRDEETLNLINKIKDAPNDKAKEEIRKSLNSINAGKLSVIGNFSENAKNEKRLNELRESDRLTKEVQEYGSSDPKITSKIREELRGKQEAAKDYDVNEERKEKLKDPKTTPEERVKLTALVSDYVTTKKIDKDERERIGEELKINEKNIEGYDKNTANVKRIKEISKDYKNEVIKLEGSDNEEIAKKIKGATSLEGITEGDKEDILKLSGMTDDEAKASHSGKDALNNNKLREHKLKLIFDKQKAIEAGIKYGESFVVDKDGVARKATDEEVLSGNFSYIDRVANKVNQVSVKHTGKYDDKEKEDFKKQYGSRRNVEGGMTEEQSRVEGIKKFRELKTNLGMGDFSGTEVEIAKIREDIKNKEAIIDDKKSTIKSEDLRKDIAGKRQEIKNLEDPAYMAEATAKWTKVEAAKKEIENKEKEMSVLKKSAGISDNIKNENLIEPTEDEKENVRKLRGDNKPNDEINKIIEDSGAAKFKFLGLSETDKKDAMAILDKGDKASGEEKKSLEKLIKKSGLDKDTFKTELDNVDKVNPYKNVKPEDVKKISEAAKKIKVLEKDKESKTSEFEEMSPSVKTAASSGANIRGVQLNKDLEKLVGDLHKTVAIGGNTKLSDFELANMQRDAELMDPEKNTSAVDKFFKDINSYRPSRDKPDSGRKEAAVLSAAMGAAATIEVEKEKDPTKRKEKEQSLSAIPAQMKVIRDLVRKSEGDRTTEEKELIGVLDKKGINKSTFGDEEEVKKLEAIAKKDNATNQEKQAATKAREEYDRGDISASGMKAISDAIPGDAGRLSANAKPTAEVAGPTEITFAKGTEFGLKGSLVLKGSNAEVTSYAVPSEPSRDAYM